jgi:4-aminobutyrate aminotransferase-like enzyme
MLVNSGSEASDLATRIARTVTEKKGIAIVKWSYHGNTQNGINISSYKFDRKGGKGPDDHILTLPLPKAFNGSHLTAEDYVNEAIAYIEQFEIEKYPLAAFIAEPISGCGGQVPLISGYLLQLSKYLRQKGILIIIDEVQTGFGRLGKWFWGFEMHGIQPDFVILGKPMGNGHPMGGVVTRTDILESFNNGMEFFSSFGGNPVSCATGNAVLETIKYENLQQNAMITGHYWKDELRKLAEKYAQFADIRGEGLFLGVECLDHNGKEDTMFANKVKNELRNNFILSSTDGPLDNVLKMKPPVCFSKDNVDQFCGSLDSILKKL